MVFLRRIITLLLSSFLMIILMGCASDRPFEYLIPSPSIPTPNKTPAPSKTRIPIPPTQRAVIKTLTPSNSCYRWDEITIDMKDDVVCVYGEVIMLRTTEEGIRFYFSEKPNTLFLLNYYQVLMDFKVHDCIKAEGKAILSEELKYLKVLAAEKCPDQ